MAAAAQFLLLLTPVAAKPAACPASSCAPGGGVQASSCLGAASLDSKPIFPMGDKNLWIRNAAPYPAELLSVSEEGVEQSQGVLAPAVRRPYKALHGEVWRARALRPGHAGDKRLMLEHRVGAIPLRECECPQPAFVDCMKPPFKGPRWTPEDPVVFRNEHPEPVDLFWWNGTCEEIVSWDEIGGMQPLREKRLQSSQGHTFRIRSAADGHMLMQHTLDDLVLRGCDEEDARERSQDRAALELATSTLEQERDELRDTLAAQLNRLVLALKAAPANSSTHVAEVSPQGASRSLLGGLLALAPKG